MATLGRSYLAEVAKNPSKNLSSAAWYSCTGVPLVHTGDLVAFLEPTVLHVSLGLGTNYVHRLKAEALALDEKWSLNVSDESLLNAFYEANGYVFSAREEVEELQQNIESKKVGMQICVPSMFAQYRC